MKNIGETLMFSGDRVKHFVGIIFNLVFNRPERFLDSDGKYCNNEMLNPFGIGRRKCLGESLARMENFLFFANIFRTFKFSRVGDELPSLEPDVGFTNGPYPYKTKITVRC